MRQSPTGVWYHKTKWNTFATPRWGMAWMLMPKAASTSIRRSLATHLGLPSGPDEVHYLDEFQGLATSDVLRLQRERGYLAVGSIRHPVTRLASCWYDKLIDDYYSEFVAYPEFRPGMPFAAFVEAVAGIPDVDAEPHFRSMAWDLVHDGAVVPDLLVDQRTLVKDWNRVRAHVAWRSTPHAWLPDLTRERPRDWRSHLGAVSGRTLEMIHQRYAADFAAFGYDDDPEASAALLAGERASVAAPR